MELLVEKMMITTILTPEITEKYVEQLIMIDSKYSSDSFYNYSREIWNKSNFLMNLPGKWHYSQIMMNTESKEIIAFIIASLFQKGVHINRFAVKYTYRKRGMGKQMMDSFITQLDINRITLMVSKRNLSAISFYEKCDFHILTGDLLKDFVQAKKINCLDIRTDYFIDNTKFHDEHCVMERNIKSEEKRE